MRILLTGASSFTGSWFAQALADAGHHVVAAFRGTAASYEGLRAERIRGFIDRVEPLWSVEFGDDRFLDMATSQSFDILCHHAAEMTDYRSWDFDPLAATAKNTRSVRPLLQKMADKGCRHIVATGSVFEPYEGIGDPQHRAFNPYGLSKHLTFEILRMEAERLRIGLSKFVIPNPFGPFEEVRFTSYLAREWLAGRVPTVGTPAYLRDNIHVGLLALAYRDHCDQLPENSHGLRGRPSGYVESQGAFALRIAREMSPRFDRDCRVVLADQKDFAEPFFRTNDQPVVLGHPEWLESKAWDDLSFYYKKTFGA